MPGCLYVIMFLTVEVFAVDSIYYVSPDGDDSNPGTRSNPLLTIDKAANKLNPGDTLYLLKGIYHQTVDLSLQGTKSQPIVISSFPGDTVIIDGDIDGDSIPDIPSREGDEGGTDPRYGNTFYWSGLVQFVDWGMPPSKHIIFRGIEVRNSAGRGISMHPGGSDITIEDCYVHHTWHTPVHMQGVTRPTVRNTVVHDGASFAPYPREGTEQNWPGNVQFTDVIDGLADGLTVYNSWGEGVLIGHSNGVILQNSVVYDNFALNVYTSHASNFIIRNNIIYSTGTPPFLRGGKACSNLIIADEYRADQANGVGQTVINNLIMGGSRNLGFWEFTWQGTENSGFVDAIIANNTILDAVTYGVEINQGKHENTIFFNNIVANPNTDAPLAVVVDDPGLNFDYNLWEKLPSRHARGQHDVVNANLGIKQNGPTDPGQVEASYFDVTDSFPGINAGVEIEQVGNDYYGNPRDSYPDIGAIEYNGPISNTHHVIVPDIYIYPNPAKDEIHVQVDNNQETRWIQLYDAKGKVHARDIGKGNISFNISRYNPGVYTVVVIDRKSQKSFKFIKER